MWFLYALKKQQKKKAKETHAAVVGSKRKINHVVLQVSHLFKIDYLYLTLQHFIVHILFYKQPSC